MAVPALFFRTAKTLSNGPQSLRRTSSRRLFSPSLHSYNTRSNPFLSDEDAEVSFSS